MHKNFNKIKDKFFVYNIKGHSGGRVRGAVACIDGSSCITSSHQQCKMNEEDEEDTCS